MISNSIRKWFAVMCLLVIEPVDPQVAMYPVFQPPVHVGVPMPVPVPVMIRVQEETSTSTTTTTERPRVVIPFPVPMPMPMPMPMPAPVAFPAFPALSCQAKKRPPGCPPCPPCVCLPACTPAFFSYCSPCHQKCRCRSKEDTPIPKPPPRPPLPPPPIMGPSFGVAIPAPPMFAPPAVVVIPFPPPRPLWRPKSSYSSSSSVMEYTESDSESESSEDYSSSSSYESRRKSRRKRKKKVGHIKKRPHHRRQLESVETSDNELVKPVLTYQSKNGDVKIKRTLTKDEADELMNDKPHRKIRIVAGEDKGNMSRILVMSTNEKKPRMEAKSHRRRQVVLSAGAAQNVLGKGKKELVFRPPSGKTISNLSVSFQISE